MKVDVKSSPVEVHLSEIKSGQCFLYNDEHYIKLLGPMDGYNAVCLQDGDPAIFDNDIDLVTSANLKVIENIE